ncbi:condensation protein [Embleya sp. NPDC005971]|uniref:condensation protein n=1 Tax=Embleya sp. NPDC005971 TaxID=3156724 RepID=UPI0033F15869
MTAARPSRPGLPVGPALARIPFPLVDEMSRHGQRPGEPIAVHMEIRLPGQPDPARLRAAFRTALRRHARVLVREAPRPWYGRRYEWELTAAPDVEPVGFPPPGPDALARARARALAETPPLSLSPPVRLDVIRSSATSGGCVLLCTIHHTALDGPSFLRVLATAAESYSGTDSTPVPERTGPPDAAAGPQSPALDPGRPPARSARVAPAPAALARRRRGNGVVLGELPVHPRPPGADHTVNDRLLVATCLTIARWNRLHAAPTRPIRITMPVDDRPRGAEMPIGNGTRLVEVAFGSREYANEPSPEAIVALLRRTARRTRQLRAAPRPPLGHGAALLTAPVLPVDLRASITRGLGRAFGPWTSTTLLSNLGRIPYPLDFGDAGRADAVWVSAPTRMPRGLTITTTGIAGRLHVGLRWSRALLDDAAGRRLYGFFADYLDTVSAAALAAGPVVAPAVGPLATPVVNPAVAREGGPE